MTTTSTSSQKSMTDPWAEWAQRLPSNESLDQGLNWLVHELEVAEKAVVGDDGRRALVDGRRTVEQLQRLLREKNPDAHLQTALREALLLRHDLNEQAAHAPFRLSADQHLTRLQALASSAARLARSLVGEAMTGDRFARDMGDLLSGVTALFEAAQQEDAAEVATEPVTLEPSPWHVPSSSYYSSSTSSGKKEEKEEEEEIATPSISQMIKGKVVPPSENPLAGPSTDLPEVLPTGADQPVAVYPGTHVAGTVLPENEKEEKEEEEEEKHNLPPISQMIKGKVVPPSANPLAGPSTDLPEVLPTGADQPPAVYPGTHTVPSVPRLGPEAPSEDSLRRRERRLQDEELAVLHDRLDRAWRTLMSNESSSRIAAEALALVRDVWNVGPSLGGADHSQIDQVLANEHLAGALRSTKRLVESFLGGGRTLDTLITRLVELYELTVKHKDAQAFFARLGAHLDALLDRGTSATLSVDGRELLRQLRELNETSLRGRLTGVVAELSLLLEQMAADSSLRELKESLAVVARDLAFDRRTGQLGLKPQLLSQLQAVVAQGVRERWEVALPEFEIAEAGFFSAKIARGKIAARHLIPRDLLVEDRGKMLVTLADLQKPSVKATANGLRLSLRGINVDMHNAEVRFRTANMLEQLPRAFKWALSMLPLPEALSGVEDAGKLSVLMGGEGMDLSLTLRTHMSPDRGLFDVERVTCRIHNLDLFISGTRYDVVYNAVLTAFADRWRQALERGIESMVKRSLEDFHQGLAGSLLQDILAPILAPIRQDPTQLARLLMNSLVASPQVKEALVPDLLRDGLFALAPEHATTARTEK